MRIEIKGDEHTVDHVMHEKGDVTVYDAFNGVGIQTDDGLFGIAQRDGGIEVLFEGEIVFQMAAMHGEEGKPSDGKEAEELRSGVEKLMGEADEGKVGVEDLQDLLDSVDARDSVRCVEQAADSEMGSEG